MGRVRNGESARVDLAGGHGAVLDLRGPVTAFFFFSCLTDVLFGSALIAAKLVPPSATNDAMNEMTSAGLGALRRRFMSWCLLGVDGWVK